VPKTRPRRNGEPSCGHDICLIVWYAIDPPMSYVVLARKWRPESFEDLVGQEHVARTLENAIKQGRVAHAFLFTGVRGVGKTTSARILAKALNCAKGPTAKPCLECDPCKQITAGTDVDVQEIDGASYNGVDEVRRLQESLPYQPSRDRFKIFIVDEVHMLSNAAWNAFLKTLEEPPPHVKFIFATTEAHKVPITILSRCQRYDFKLIGAQAIMARLRHVLEAEKIEADDASLAILAREAAGSMRDAMSLLDQVIAWAGGESGLTAEAVGKVLGVAERADLHELLGGLIDGDAARCLAVVERMAENGYDLVHVARDVLANLRDLVVAGVVDDPSTLLDLPEAEIAEVKKLAGQTSPDDLTRLHQGFSKSFDDVAKSGQPRAALEMTLVRLARRPPLLPVDELLRRLADLERRVREGAVASGGSGGSGNLGAGRSGAGRSEGGRPRESAGGRASSASAGEVDAAPAEPPPAPTLRATTRPTSSAAAPPASSPAAPAPAAPAPAPTAPRVSPPDEVLAQWRDVVDRVRGRRAALASVLEHAAILRLDADKGVVLGYEQGSFLIAQVNEPQSRAVALKAIEEVVGKGTTLEIETLTGSATHETLARIELADRKARVEDARKAVEQHPLVDAAKEHLGAQLREVRLPSDLADSVTGR